MTEWQHIAAMPHVSWCTRPDDADELGGVWIDLRCTGCGPEGDTTKRCRRPELVGRWVGIFATLHKDHAR